MPLSKEEIAQIVTRTADEVMERVREQEHDSLMLHSIPYSEGSPGIVVDEAVAKATPCRCIEYKPAKYIAVDNAFNRANYPEEIGKVYDSPPSYVAVEKVESKKLCFSKGIIGALSDEQENIYCPTTIPLESPGLEKRLKGWMEAVETCKAEIAEIPKGERLEPWLSCMSRELAPEESNPGKELWEMTLEEYAFEKGARPDWVKAGYGETYRTHKRAVERAISEGKPIPPKVLADYPELLKKSNLGGNLNQTAAGTEYVTITHPGKTTFKVGEVVSREAFEKENERVKKLGEKPATGR